jgi:hypothetical protein
MSFLETQHGPTLRGMLDMLVEVPPAACPLCECSSPCRSHHSPG